MGTGASEPCLDVQWSSYNYRWWSPINHRWGPRLRTNLTPVKQHVYRNVQLLSLYVNSVNFFIFFIFPAIQSNFV